MAPPSATVATSPLPCCHFLDLMQSDDTLRALLLWTRASDHFHLRLTCRRIKEVLNSSTFRWERCDGGFADIKVILSKPASQRGTKMKEDKGDDDEGENYDEIGYKDPVLGYRTNFATFWIDRINSGSTRFIIIPRQNFCNNNNFHTIADSLRSDDLSKAATQLFDGRGRPILPSLQEALVTTNDNRAGFLHLATFYLYDEVHRSSSWIGAMILRALLMDTPLKDQWSVAAYIPEADAQFSDEDELTNQKQKAARMEARFVHGAGMSFDDEEERTKEACAWRDYCDELIKRDMQHFFRAGFRQVQETIYESSCFFLVAVPFQLEQPLLTLEETASIPIVEKPADKKAGLSDDEFELVEMVKGFCSERNSLVKQILDAERLIEAPMEHPRVRCIQGARDLERSFTVLQTMEQECHDMRAQLLERNDESFEPGQKQELLEKLRVRMEETIPDQRRSLDACKQPVILGLREVGEKDKAEFEEELVELDQRARSDTECLIELAGTDIIESSDVIHACAYNLEPTYLKLVISLIPDATKRLRAVNALDRHGQTALMTAARSSNYDRYTIDNRFKTCQALMDAGADKNIVDSCGLTALGRFRRNTRENRIRLVSREGWSSPEVRAEIEAMSAMETLLLPLQGATWADNAVLEESDETEDDEEVDWEDEDEEDEDWEVED